MDLNREKRLICLPTPSSAQKARADRLQARVLRMAALSKGVGLRSVVVPCGLLAMEL
jgi:hypothetical protein